MNQIITHFTDPRNCMACEAYQNERVSEFCSNHDKFDIPAKDRPEDTKFESVGDFEIDEMQQNAEFFCQSYEDSRDGRAEE